MHRMKIPPQDFALKMQGGLCARGGVFAGHYGNYRWCGSLTKVEQGIGVRCTIQLP